MTIPFVLRPIDRSKAGLAAALELYRQCEDFLALGPVAVASPAMVLADLELSDRSGGTFYGIYDPAGALIGVVDYLLAGFEGDGGLAYLELLMIAAPYRGQGLGVAVVAQVEADIRADGRARAIRAGVQANNPAACRFWARLGYQTISGPAGMPDGTVCFQLLKKI